MGTSRMLGTQTNKLDANGRVAIPAKFREMLGDEVYITLGENDCLSVYSEANYDRMLDKLEQMADVFSNDDARQTLRRIYGDTEVLVPDKQGRVLLTVGHREHAQLIKEQEVVFRGAGDHLEIWNREILDSYNTGFKLEVGARAFKTPVS